MKNSKEIKILATLGPSSLKKNIVENMDSSGVDLFRINLSHTKIENLPRIVTKLQHWTKKPICFDTQGAQVRTGQMKKNRLFFKNNDSILITSSNIKGDKFHLPLYPINPAKMLKSGDILYVDFNKAIIQVVKKKGKKVEGRVLAGGLVGSNKAVHLNRFLELPAFTKEDFRAFRVARELGISYFSISFASRKNDIKNLRKLFPYKIFVISKIESRAGLENMKEICDASDAILIDRLDLTREVPLQKIGLAQKHILEVAKSRKTPVFVATNLLESMLKNFEPTRAEVNDITSSLTSGATGLVLAAETAIGNYPVESVRMVSGIIKAVEDDKKRGNKEDFLKTIYDYNLIEPHGGVLIQNHLNLKEIKNIKNLPRIRVADEILLDAFQMAEGIYSPLKGFMNKEEVLSVLEKYRLPNGIIWPLPVIFQLTKRPTSFGGGDRVILESKKEKEALVLLEVSKIEEIDIKKIAKKWFGTDDKAHPGVWHFSKMGNYIISGEVFSVRKPISFSQLYDFTPKETREILKQQGWQKIVGFHTRNVIHRGHEFIQKKALEKVKADALFVSPVVGPKKKGDFLPQAILRSYEIMMKKNYYSPYPVFIAAFHTYSRYSGPREAVFTALCRKNFGCSHFIIGRDHTGVGNYYSPDASQRIFEKIGDIGIIPLFFNEVYFCKVCQKTTDKCSHSLKERMRISGTAVRNYLLENKSVPPYLMRKDISKELQKMSKKSPRNLFEI